MGEAVLEALKESLISLPILFIVYFLMELIENKQQVKFEKFVARSKKTGPLWGSLIGCIPQCAFSAVMADLFSRKMITIGTLFAVFIATSDEAIAVLLSNPEKIGSVFVLILVKLIIAILIGFIIDLIYKNQKLKVDSINHNSHYNHEHTHKHNIVKSSNEEYTQRELNGEVLENTEENDVSNKEIIKSQENVKKVACESCEHCSVCKKEEKECEECEHNKLHHKHQIEEVDKKHNILHIFLEALRHTAIIFAWILGVNLVLGVLLHFIGLEGLKNILLSGTIFEPIILSLIALIPNCASSVAIVDLYINGVVGFGSAIGALCTCAGLGLIILFKNNKNVKQNILITISLYAIGVLVGFILNLLFLAIL